MMIKKFTSRKFITAFTGIITGVLLIAGGNTTEGVTAVVSAVVAYCIAEGYVDAKKLDFNSESDRENFCDKEEF